MFQKGSQEDFSEEATLCFQKVERMGREGRRRHLRACFLPGTWLCSQVGAYSKGLTWTEEWKGLPVTKLILCL